ncbi:hypothetical protein [Alkalimonas amylolytica]|uniref:Holin-X, holin superfamily III n=1 Tax=Alkalimonas amylolytica TaxID=152573 RepID=A0A1H4BGU2_ALKAM|nr:hypothetical protein [Alkalimonas amylolytica]SEA47228.1 hypothetical protein SAMN04488051_103349 [Alkalimonas amylolytica]
MPAKPTQTPADAGVSPSEPELSAELSGWWLQLKVLLHDQLELLTLEGERVARSMVALYVFGLIAGLLALTLWFGALAQIILLAQQTTLSAWQSLGLAMIVNALGLWLVLNRCAYYSSLLRFPATIQSLRPAPAPITLDKKD